MPGPRRRIALETAAALVFYSAVACLVTWPVPARIDSTVLGSVRSDSAGTIAWLWRLQHEDGFRIVGSTHHALTGAALGWVQGNGLNVQWALPYYPAYLLTKLVGEVAAFNLVVLSGLVFSGCAMYLLVRRLDCSALVAAWAGVAFVVFPSHLHRALAGHASLVHLEVFPLLLLALVETVRRRSPSRVALVGVASLTAWLTSGYFGLMAVVVVGAFGLAWIATARSKGALAAASASIAAALAAGSVVVGIAALGSGADSIDVPRDVGDLSIYGLRPAELVVPPSGNLVLGNTLAGYHNTHYHGAGADEATNYVGLLTIALACAWGVIAVRRRRALSVRVQTATAGFLTVVLAALAFAAPSPVGVAGRLWEWTPSRLMFELVPAFRVPSRWTLVLAAALVPLAALGLQAGVSWLAARRESQWTASVVVGAAIVGSFLELSILPGGPTYRTGPLPALYGPVRVTEGVLAEYPLTPATVGQYAEYGFWQRVHGRPLLNGAGEGSRADDARGAAVHPSAPGTAARLAWLGVTTIVTRSDALDYSLDEPAADVPGADWGSGYKLVERFGDGSSVWRVVASPAPALATLSDPDFGSPHAPDGTFVGQPLMRSPARIDLRAAAHVTSVLHVIVDAKGGGRQAVTLSDGRRTRLVQVDGRRLVSVPVAIPAGDSHLEVAAPGAQPGEVSLSAPWFSGSTRTKSLRAIPTSQAAAR